MKQTALLLASLALAFALPAALPAPEKLLAADTLAVLTVPDWAKSKVNFANSPQGQLWDDPVMKPFRDKFTAKFTSAFLAPVEKELGIKLADYASLLQGQVTFALTQNGWEGKPDQKPGFLLLIDTKTNSMLLTTNLATLRKQWVDGGKQIKTSKIRDVEFTTLIFTSDELSKSIGKIFPNSDAAKNDPNANAETLEDPKPKTKTEKIEWLLGQSDSLLIVGSSAKDIEKVMILQSGGPVPPLAEQPGFAANAASLRDSISFGWLNTKTIVDVASKEAARANGGQPNQRTPFAVDKALSALGLTGLQSLAFSARDSGDGSLVNFALNIPEAQRKGLFKILAADAKDSSPPAFIPADAVKFNRWRLDLQKGWATLEAMLIEMSPQMSGVIKLVLDNAGKDKDPTFNIRQSLFGNLGDDIITYEKVSRGNTVVELNNAPSLVLLGSRNAEQLAGSVRAITSVMPQQMTKYKEREFLGRKIHSLTLPQQGGGQPGQPAERSLNYAASGGYVVFSSDNAMLEEYLRSSEGGGKALRDLPGLNDAAQKVGGMGTGFFAMENQSETARVAIETLRKDSGAVGAFLGGSALGGRLGMADDAKALKEWFDFSLLPPYASLAKYFYLGVYSGTVTADGMNFKLFTPTPPLLKK